MGRRGRHGSEKEGWKWPKEVSWDHWKISLSRRPSEEPMSQSSSDSCTGSGEWDANGNQTLDPRLQNKTVCRYCDEGKRHKLLAVFAFAGGCVVPTPPIRQLPACCHQGLRLSPPSSLSLCVCRFFRGQIVPTGGCLRTTTTTSNRLLLLMACESAETFDLCARSQQIANWVLPCIKSRTKLATASGCLLEPQKSKFN